MRILLSKRIQLLQTRAVVFGGIAATILATACGPSDVGAGKLKSIPKGAHRPEILSVMGTGPLVSAIPADAPRIINGFRRQMYLTGGKTYEIFWYRDEPGSLNDAIVRERETPVVMQGDTLLGWGWKFYSPFAKQINLPDPSHDKERADSIMKAQNPGKK
ncbi:MAG: hypothetical protein M3Y64_04685 [Gemmatimonadota bacterium]|nr:hypothetical protein [Gemmatimonadota bacterium]